MCGTCGCSGDGPTVISLDPAGPAHPHDDEHGHGHDHPHGSEDPHDHPHPPPARPATTVVALELDLFAKNDLLAARNRGWFEGRGIVALNVMSSPGSGKTSLLVRTIRELSTEFDLSVIEGDQETVLDAERIKATGCKVVQINTGSGCHLDADMLACGLRTLDPPARSVVFVENVGNLVCPAMFDLGESSRVVVMSVTEGDDKPLKYPQMFRAADVLVLNKVDLLPYVDFDVERCLGYARQINPQLEAITVSVTKGDGMDEWYDWLRGQLAPVARSAATSSGAGSLR